MQTLSNTITSAQAGILKALLYFDVFRYPLTKHELFEKAQTVLRRADFDEELRLLQENGMIRFEQDFVLPTEATSADIQKRVKGNAGAASILPTAVTYSRRIAGFPFVEGVFISGGLSKNYYDENSDIDFFIVTRPGRLWICRTLLILRYKTLPKAKKKYWCTNYFIASNNLLIPDQNVFTSSELAHLIPMTGHAFYKQLLETNAWYKKTYPNMPEVPSQPHMQIQAGLLKRFSEWVLGGRLGAIADTWLLNWTLRRWRNKYPELSDAEFDLLFRTRRDVCKRHQHGFQNKVLAMWSAKIKKFEEQFNVSLG